MDFCNICGGVISAGIDPTGDVVFLLPCSNDDSRFIGGKTIFPIRSTNAYVRTAGGNGLPVRLPVSWPPSILLMAAYGLAATAGFRGEAGDETGTPRPNLPDQLVRVIRRISRVSGKTQIGLYAQFIEKVSLGST